MAQEWGSLPLLPLRCVLDHLSMEDALAAMSTCRHWRSAMLLYEGRKEILKLRVKQMRKAMFLSRIFRRHTRKLHISLDGNQDDLDKFVSQVLPQFFATVELRELIFIAPNYLQPNQHVPLLKLKKIITESLFFKNIHCMETFALVGCQLGDVNEDERHVHKHVEHYSRGLLFTRNNFMSVINMDIHSLTSNLRHLIVEYSQISTACLLTLEPLRQLRYLTLNITNRRVAWPKIDWRSVQLMYKVPLEVTLNIISVPCKKFNDIIDNVLGEDMNLVSLKVMFCKSLYYSLLGQVSQLYAQSLVEVVWVDVPNDSNDHHQRIVRPFRRIQPDGFAHVNPFVLLCWQCVRLRRLVIHGYWMWHYDLLGFVRLRKSLTQLEISSVYYKEGRFNEEVQLSEEGAVRVMLGDVPTKHDISYIDEINLYTEFKWQPMSWRSLHPGLKARSTHLERANYILTELRRTPTDTLC